MPGLHVTIDPENPISVAICDGCGFEWLRTKLQWQYQWAGNELINRKLLHCPLCLDVPNEQLRNPNLKADPVPVKNPRPDQKNDVDDIMTEGLDFLDTESDDYITTEN